MEGDGAGQGVGDGNWTKWTIVDRTCTRSELRKAGVICFINTERICLHDYCLQSCNSFVDIIVPKLLIDFGVWPKITNGFWDYSPKITN